MANDYNQDMIQALRIFNRGDYHEARRKFTQLAAVKAQDPHVRLWLGAACFEIGYFEDAKTHWQTALGLTSDAKLVQLIENSLVQLSKAQLEPATPPDVDFGRVGVNADSELVMGPDLEDDPADLDAAYLEDVNSDDAEDLAEGLEKDLANTAFAYDLSEFNPPEPEQTNPQALPSWGREDVVLDLDSNSDPWVLTVGMTDPEPSVTVRSAPVLIASDPESELLTFEKPLPHDQADISALATPLYGEPEPRTSQTRPVAQQVKPILPPPRQRKGSLKWQAAFWAAGISLFSVASASAATYLITQESLSRQINQSQQGQIANPQEEANYLNRRLLLGLLVAATGSTLVAVVVALAASKPLRRGLINAREATQRIAYGDFNTRVLIKGEDEIGSLGVNLNYMAASLQALFDELAKLRALDAKINRNLFDSAQLPPSTKSPAVPTQITSVLETTQPSDPTVSSPLPSAADLEPLEFSLENEIESTIPEPLPSRSEPIAATQFAEIEMTQIPVSLVEIPPVEISQTEISTLAVDLSAEASGSEALSSEPVLELAPVDLTPPPALVTAADLPDSLLDQLLEEMEQVELFSPLETIAASEIQPEQTLTPYQSELQAEPEHPAPLPEPSFDPAALHMALRQLQLIQATVSNLTLQAQQANWQAERARALLQTSDEMIAGTAASFLSLQESVSRATARLATLKLLSQQGSSVIDAISQFTERTNQLAINTAISAERSALPSPQTGQLSNQMRSLVDDAELISSEIAHLLLALQTDLPQTSQVLAVGTSQLAENWQQVQNSREQLSQVIQALATSGLETQLTPLPLPSELPSETLGEDPVHQLTTLVTDLQSQVAQLQTKLVSVGAAR